MSESQPHQTQYIKDEESLKHLLKHMMEFKVRRKNNISEYQPLPQYCYVCGDTELTGSESFTKGIKLLTDKTTGELMCNICFEACRG